MLVLQLMGILLAGQCVHLHLRHTRYPIASGSRGCGKSGRGPSCCPPLPAGAEGAPASWAVVRILDAGVFPKLWPSPLLVTAGRLAANFRKPRRVGFKDMSFICLTPSCSGPLRTPAHHHTAGGAIYCRASRQGADRPVSGPKLFLDPMPMLGPPRRATFPDGIQYAPHRQGLPA